MKKLFLVWIAMVFFLSTNAQSEHQNLLRISTSSIDKDLKEKVSAYTVLSLDTDILRQIEENNAKQLFIQIPQKGGESIQLVLMQNRISKPNASYYALNKKKKREISVQPGNYYKGYIRGEKKSIVSFSIYNGEMRGLISTPEGDFILGKIKGDLATNNEYILYNDDDLLITPNFGCGTVSTDVEIPKKNPLRLAPQEYEAGCIGIYFECDYHMYLHFNSSVNEVMNYTMALFNEVTTLFANDGIVVAISSISVWEGTDPYDTITNNSRTLDMFTTLTNSSLEPMTGDLGHLLSKNPLRQLEGGLAQTDVLCNPYQSFAVSQITDSYEGLPTYSWDVAVVTHEIGHNIGSPHTHDCVWNDPINPTQIDDCGNIAPTNDNNLCDVQGTPIIPSASTGGTIMSYCHTLGTASSVKFSNGFGSQPATLLQSKITTAIEGNCLGDCCPISANFINPGRFELDDSFEFVLNDTDQDICNQTWIIVDDQGVTIFTSYEESFIFEATETGNYTICTEIEYCVNPLCTENLCQDFSVNCPTLDLELFLPTTAEVNQPVEFYYDGTNGEIEAGTFIWTINSAVITDTNPLVHTFTDVGFYKICLSGAVSDFEDCPNIDGCYFIEITCPIEAAFVTEVGIEPFYYYVNEPIQFTNTSLGQFEEVIWNFDDGQNSTDTNPIHSYSQAGYYNVEMTAAYSFPPYCTDVIQLCILVVPNNTTEICDNGFDDDGDGLIDCFDPDCCDECVDNYFNCEISCGDQESEFEFSMVQEILQTPYLSLWSGGASPVVGNIDNDPQSEIIGIPLSPHYFPIFDGETMETQEIVYMSDFSPLLNLNSISTPVLIDFNSTDGQSNIVFVASVENSPGAYLACFNIGGNQSASLEWVSDTPIIDPLFNSSNGDFSGLNPNVADFNEDGIAEVYIFDKVYNGLTGEEMVSGDGAKIIPLGNHSGGIDFLLSNTIAADVLPDNYCAACRGPELIAGSVVYAVNLDPVCNDSSIEVIREAPWFADDFDQLYKEEVSIADVNNDGKLDAVITQSFLNGAGKIIVWDIQTDNVHAQFNSSLARYARPTLSNWDNDGRLEIAVVSSSTSTLHLFDMVGTNLNEVGTMTISTQPYSRIGITAFDFDKDGFSELVFQDGANMNIVQFDVVANQIVALAQAPIFEWIQFIQYPVIADLDANGTASILGVSIQGPHVYSSNASPWAATRSVWNQYNYNTTNINDDLSVPRQSQQNQLINDPLLNAFPVQYPIYNPPLPDAAITLNSVNCEGEEMIIKVNLCNEGTAVLDADMYFSIYDVDPFNLNNVEGNLLLSGMVSNYQTTPANIDAGGCIELVIPLITEADEVYIVFNNFNEVLTPMNNLLYPIPFIDRPYTPLTYEECSYSNNQLGPIQNECDLPCEDVDWSEIDILISHLTPVIGEQVSFSLSESSLNCNYSWALANGESPSGPAASQSFDEPGTYKICVTIDCDGCITTICNWVTVINPCINTFEITMTSPNEVNQLDYIAGVIEMDNKNYMVAGITYEYIAEGAIYVSELTPDGNIISYNTITGSAINDPKINDIIKLENGTIVLAGTYLDFDGNNEVVLIALKEDGSLYWVEDYSINGQLTPTEIIQNSEGNIVVLCDQTESANPFEFELLEISPNGDLANNNTHNYKMEVGNFMPYVSSIVEVPESENQYIIAGSFRSTSTGIAKGTVSRMNKNTGEMLWNRSFSNNGEYAFESVIIVGSEIIATGISTTASNLEVLIASLRFDGSTNWTKTITTTDLSFLNPGLLTYRYAQLIKVDEGYQLRLLPSASGAAGPTAVFMISLNDDFEITSSYQYGGNELDGALDFMVTSNKDIVLVGGSNSFNSSLVFDPLIVKTNNIGLAYNCPTVSVPVFLNNPDITAEDNAYPVYHSPASYLQELNMGIKEQTIDLNTICSFSCCELFEEAIISSDLIDQNLLIDQVITIPNGSIITIDNSVIRFTPNGKIEVEPEAKLIITNNSVLTKDTYCGEGGLWKGVELLSYDGGSLSNSSNGTLLMTYGATIQYAKTGILVVDGKGNMENAIDLVGAYFLNNTVAINIKKANSKARFGFHFSKNVFAHTDPTMTVPNHFIDIRKTRLADNSNSLINNNFFRNVNRAIYIENAFKDNLAINYNIIEDNYNWAIDLKSTWTDNGMIPSSTIANSTVFNIKGNEIQSRNGIRARRTNQINLELNDFNVDQAGINIENVHAYSIFSNTIIRNTSTVSWSNGLRVFNGYLSDYAQVGILPIESNYIENFRNGLIFTNYQATNHELSIDCNVLVNNERGLFLHRILNGVNPISNSYMLDFTDLDVQGGSGAPVYNSFINNITDIISNHNSNILQGYHFPQCQTGCSIFEPQTVSGPGNISNLFAEQMSDSSNSCEDLNLARSGQKTSTLSTKLKESEVQHGPAILFPNPVSNLLEVSELNGLNTIELITVNGQKIYSVSSKESAITVDMSQFKNGIYFIRIVNKTLKGAQIEKIIKLK